MKPEKQLPSPFSALGSDDEDKHQAALFMWADKAARHGFAAAYDPQCYQDFAYTMQKYSNGLAVTELAYMYAIPNGELRHPAVAMRLKQQGVKKGVPDIHLPISTRHHCGLYIEMKKAGKGKLSPEQQKYIDFLTINNYKVDICYSWHSAAEAIINYLTTENKND